MEVKKVLLSPSTAEFAYLEYGLQLALRSSTARIISAHAISNPHLSVQFEKRCKDILTLNSWVDASSLVGANTEDEVIRRGFQFTSTALGMRFPVGSLLTGGPCGTAGFDNSDAPRRALYCKIGVGRARVVDHSVAEREAIPDKYDSFYLGNGELQNDKEYFHEYLLKSSDQILPMYIIQYEHDPSREKASREKPKCDVCDVEVATVYCPSDAANLCNKCDTQSHSTKLSSRHVRSPIGKGADVFGFCRHHPEKLIEFFCSQCHIPVCVFCKMVGNHANGEAAKHQLVSVSEAYQTVVQEAKETDPVLQTRRAEIANQIIAVNHRAKAVEKMRVVMEAQIEDMFRKAMADLHGLVRDKLDTLLGDEVELKRQLAEIEFLEEFLRYQQSGDASQFLFNWVRHQQYRAELHDFRFFRNEIDVDLDIKVTGGIAVGVDAHHPPVATPQRKASRTSAAATPSATGSAGAGMVGLGVPRKLQDRRVQRRTSDFFAESLAIAPALNWMGGMDEVDDQRSVFGDDRNY
ncbi:hypothetical protein DFJ73DRAFT_641345 [Zopfochytrium polystomum]|nr:hypothetical protein DFJ73DRAFT_641345 [Zopfochytrium polystomum]